MDNDHVGCDVPGHVVAAWLDKVEACLEAQPSHSVILQVAHGPVEWPEAAG